MAILEVNDLKQYFYIDPGLLAKTGAEKTQRDQSRRWNDLQPGTR